jgi:hypothetical protein
VDPELLYPLRHQGEESQTHIAIIRSREALVDCRTQLVNPGYAERSSPLGLACPSARPEAFTRKPPPTYLRRFGWPLGRDYEGLKLVGRLAPRLHRGATGGSKRPDHLHATVRALGRACRLAGQYRPGGSLGI